MFEQVFRDDYPRPVQDPNPSDSPSIYICVGFIKAQQLSEENRKPTNTCPLSLQIPAPYHTYFTISNKRISKRLPVHTSWDHATDLTPGFKPKPCKTYPLLPVEQVELDTFLNENLAKGYICPSKSSMASPSSLLKRKTKSYALFRTTASSTREPSRTSIPFPLYLSLLTSLRVQGSSLKPTCGGVTIMFESKKKTSGRARLRQIAACLNLR